MYLAQSTWRALGLSVAAGYAALGATAIFAPGHEAEYLFALAPLRGKGEGSRATPAHLGVGDSDTAVRITLPLLGARDWSIGIAIASLGYQGAWREAGTVILAGLLLGVADVYVIWRRRGAALGSLFAAGLTSWGVIGYGLLNWYE